MTQIDLIEKAELIKGLFAKRERLISELDALSEGFKHMADTKESAMRLDFVRVGENEIKKPQSRNAWVDPMVSIINSLAGVEEESDENSNKGDFSIEMNNVEILLIAKQVIKIKRLHLKSVESEINSFGQVKLLK